MRIALYPATGLAVIAAISLFAQPQEIPMSIGPRFQKETCYDSGGLVGTNVSYGTRTPEFKDYRNRMTVKLPVVTAHGIAVEDAIHRRQSARRYADKPLTEDQLTQLLIAANGLTHTDAGMTHRSIPSAGGLNPLEIYAVVTDVTGLERGLYHFNVLDTCLELLKEGELGPVIQHAALGQESVGDAALNLVISARFARTTQKYADRGYRYIYMEVGSAMQNVYLQSASLGLGTVAVGAFNDVAVNTLLEIDGMSESALLIMPIGHPVK